MHRAASVVVKQTNADMFTKKIFIKLFLSDCGASLVLVNLFVCQYCRTNEMSYCSVWVVTVVLRVVTDIVMNDDCYYKIIKLNNN